MRSILALALLLAALVSCTAIEALTETAKTATATITEVRTWSQQILELLKQLLAQLADFLAAGKAIVTPTEGGGLSPEAIGTLAGGGGAIIATLAALARSVFKTDQKRSESSGEIHGRVNEVLARVSKLEGTKP